MEAGEQRSGVKSVDFKPQSGLFYFIIRTDQHLDFVWVIIQIIIAIIIIRVRVWQK
jgi:hypothetical protein